jgi:hypothetical protein
MYNWPYIDSMEYRKHELKTSERFEKCFIPYSLHKHQALMNILCHPGTLKIATKTWSYMLFLKNWHSQVKDDHTNIVQPDMVQYIYLNTLFTHTHIQDILRYDECPATWLGCERLAWSWRNGGWERVAQVNLRRGGAALVAAMWFGSAHAVERIGESGGGV